MANNKNITFDQLQSSMTKIKGEIDKKANTNHGTHVKYYDDNPKVAGTVTAGRSSRLSRGDHVHPAQTSVTGSSGSCTGNAATATKLQTARNIALTGTITGNADFDGSGNISIATSVGNTPVSGNWFKGVPVLTSAGVMEVGKYIDFHNASDSTADYDVRLQCNGTSSNTVNMPTGNGTLALLDDNVASATKLQTARKLTIGSTEKKFNGTADVAWTLDEIGAAAASHNHTSLTSVTKLQFAAASSDYAAIKVTTNDANTYLDFEMNDDINTDMYRWRFSAWDSSAQAATGQFDLMTLASKDASSARLTVNGDVTASSFTGNASTATKLKTARKIGKASFNGTSDIYLSNIMGRATTTSSSNSYTYYITVTNEFEGINNIKVYFYNSDGTFNSRVAYSSTSLTPGIPFKIAFPTTTGTFRVKADFLTTNTLENINDRLIITKVVEEPSESTSEQITPTWETGNFNGSTGAEKNDSSAMRTDHMAFNTNSHINQYTKFARIDVSSGSYVNCAGKFSFMHTEDKKVGGILEYYFRTNETISSATIDLSWSSLTDKDYIDCISAVKVSDGVYDLYYQAKNHWDTTRITNIDCSEPDLITLYSDQGYVSSITPVCTSSLNAQYVDNIYTDYVSGNSLTLTTDKYQYVSITSNTTINLPSVSSFTEIHLFFDWPSRVSITMPSNVKWQEGVMYGPGYTHEFVFTYINSTIGWLGGCVVYG